MADQSTRKKDKELGANEAAAAAIDVARSLIGKEALGIASLEPTEDGWLVGVEVLEHARVPSTSDILGLYEVEIALDGELISYRRARRYTRVETGRSEAGP